VDEVLECMSLDDFFEENLEAITNDSLIRRFGPMGAKEIIDYVLGDNEEADSLRSSLVFSYMVLAPERASEILEEAARRPYFQRNEKPWRMSVEEYENGGRRFGNI